MKKSNIKKTAGALIVLFILIQFFGTEKNKTTTLSENAIEKHYTVSPKVQGLLKNSCYDCHSNNTVYPWYSQVQPVEWWLASDIKNGKKHLNFDEFNSYTAEKKIHKLEEVAETVHKNEMPLGSYTLIHRQSKLSDADKMEIESWAMELKKEIQ